MRNAAFDLERAERIDPPVFPKQKISSLARQGLAYEKRVGKYLQDLYKEHEVLRGPWFRYYDRYTGPYGKMAQPDILIVPQDTSVPLTLIECKLTYKAGAKKKLERLYRPIVQSVYPEHRINTIQVFRSIPEGFDMELDYRLNTLYDQDMEHRSILERI